MAKDKNMKASFMAMLQNTVGSKQIPQVHRGPLLCLLSNAVYPDQRDDSKCSYLVRLPFGDYADLTIDDRCIEYLKSVYRTLEEQYEFSSVVADLKKDGENIPDRIYRHYCEWLAIKETFDFLYLGDYYEHEPDNDPDSEYDSIADIA